MRMSPETIVLMKQKLAVGVNHFKKLVQLEWFLENQLITMRIPHQTLTAVKWIVCVRKPTTLFSELAWLDHANAKINIKTKTIPIYECNAHFR